MSSPGARCELTQHVLRGLDELIDVFLPPACAACDAVLPAPGAFCAHCLHEVLELPTVHCATCAEPGSFPGGKCERCRGGVPWQRAWAPFEHEGAIARVIHRFKYEDRSDLARPLGMLLLGGLERLPGVLVPLPLHEHRFRARKFDQAALLAHVLSRYGRRELVLNGLARIRHTPRQVGLNEAAREANVRGAFQASASVRGREVLLLDDVLTSGATAREACRVLSSAGATSVCVLTLARARSFLRGEGS